MTTIAVKKSAWDGMNEAQQSVMTFIGEQIRLGEPAVYKDAINTEWYIWDDHRFTARDVAIIGAVAANLARIPASWNRPDAEGSDYPSNRGAMREKVLEALGNRLKLPENITIPEDTENPLQYILEQNGSPAAVKVGSNVPDTWTPVGEDAE